ncbi:D-tyrosyl-tRNA(Tyr) deacylase [Candidatus Bathyarchaeota archaeon]|nr:MAG: D-tyrosyl-tRNA(Tyr) deacylase [Candidatus Bathyarchaeota archaeon]
MTVLIAASKLDPAGVNIAQRLLENFSFKETDRQFEGNTVYHMGDVLFIYLEGDTIHAGHLTDHFDVDAVIFVSRHECASGRPMLTTHVPGNLGWDSSHGGKPRQIAWASPSRVKAALLKLKEMVDSLKLNYPVTLEVTHHGPTELRAPALFVEIGSDPERWKDEKAALAVAEAALAAATHSLEATPAVGYGGTHYAPKQTQAALETELAVGHIVPKYAFREEVDPWLALEPVRRTWGGCKTAIIDWKGVRGRHRQWLVKLLEEQDIEIIRV